MHHTQHCFAPAVTQEERPSRGQAEMWGFRDCVSTHASAPRSCCQLMSVAFATRQDYSFSNGASHSTSQLSALSIRGDVNLILRLAVPLDSHRRRYHNVTCNARNPPPPCTKCQYRDSPLRNSILPSPSSLTARSAPTRNSSTVPDERVHLHVGADTSLATTPFTSTAPMARDISESSHSNPNSTRRRGGDHPNAHLPVWAAASSAGGNTPPMSASDLRPCQPQRVDGSVPFSSLSGLPVNLVRQLQRHGFTDTTAIQTLALPPLLQGE